MPVFDAHQNLAISAVATAPSPATSGTSLVVTTGQGARFPAAPFNVTIWPAATQPDPSNAEVVRVTAVATDTLTIVRAQEGTSARTVVVTDQIAVSVTAKTLTDVETWVNQQQALALGTSGVQACYTVPGAALVSGSTTTTTLNANRDWYFPVLCADTVTFDQVALEVTTAAGASTIGRIGLYFASNVWQPTGTLIEDFGSVAIDSIGVKTLAPAATTRKLQPGRYVLAYNATGNAVVRAYGCAEPGGLQVPTFMGANVIVNGYFNTRTNAAFPSAPTAYTSMNAAGTGFLQTVLMHVTAVGT